MEEGWGGGGSQTFGGDSRDSGSRSAEFNDGRRASGGGSQTFGGGDHDEDDGGIQRYRPLQERIAPKPAQDVRREDLLKELENVRRVTAKLLEDFNGAYSDKRAAYANAYFRGVHMEAMLVELLESRSAPTKRPIAGRKPF